MHCALIGNASFALFAGGAAAESIGGLVLWIALLLLAAKLGGDLAVRIRQPAVLGEIAAGVLLGNLHYIGFGALEQVKSDPGVAMLAELGVLLLLFEVGLESTVAQMLRVGLSSLFVASLGVAAPFALGWATSALLLPMHSAYVHAFLGATLTATSVGITARVLRDIGRADSPEARVILGAAVVDDVFGLVILAVVSGSIASADAGSRMSYTEIALVVFKALLFLVGALVLGVQLSPRLFHFASKLRARGVLLATGLAFCFLLAHLASRIGLAPIVGAFAAGLILEQLHYREFVSRGEHGLEDLVRPISSFLVPIFFVLMGMRTDLAAFAHAGVVLLAVTLTIAAVIGKQLCGFGVVTRGVDRIVVGIGMIPRGEVGLIFANIGLTLSVHGERVVDPFVFSAIVLVVMSTTMLAPPLLTWRLGRIGTGVGREPKPVGRTTNGESDP